MSCTHPEHKGWANFLCNEKLNPESGRLPELCAALTAKGLPKWAQYKDKVDARRLVCETAMDLGLDLSSIQDHKGRSCKMGRGLLDVW